MMAILLLDTGEIA